MSKKIVKEKRNKEIAEYYLAGHTTAETGLRFGLAQSAIFYILKQQGVRRRPPGPPKGHHGKARRILDGERWNARLERMVEDLEKKGAL